MPKELMMLRFHFKRGLTLDLSGKPWNVIRRLKNGAIQLESEEGELKNESESTILEWCKTGDAHIDLASAFEKDAKPLVARDLASYPKHLQDRALYRFEYLRRLADENGRIVFTKKTLLPKIATVAAELRDPSPPCFDSIRVWNSRYQHGRSVTSLVDRHEHKGRTRNWSEPVQSIVDFAIDTVLLNPQKHPGKEVYEEIERNVKAFNKGKPVHLQEKIPSRSSIYRYLNLLEEYDLVFAREGKAAAQTKYRAVFGKQSCKRILERWEIDHTPLNLLVFCKRTGLPMGKPWLTLIIDKASRMVMGFYIGFHTPSAYSVLQCVKQAILHKESLIAAYPDINSSWPARGIPEVLVCDNGMELHSHALAEACQEMGIQLQFCPSKKPWYKGAIERFLRTINHDLIHRLPGTVFSNPIERGDYASEKLASIDFEALIHIVTKWIVEVYCQSRHRALKTTPLKKWEMGEQERVIEHPADPAQLDVIIGHVAERRVFHYGVEVNSLYYNNSQLKILRCRHGEHLRVRLKHYEDDLGYVYVFDPDHKSYFHVPANDQEYASGLRLIQHEIIRNKLKEEESDPDKMENLLQKKKELQGLIDAAASSNKMAKRKKSFVVSGVNSVPVKPTLLRKKGSGSKKNRANENNKPSELNELELPTFAVRPRATNQ